MTPSNPKNDLPPLDNVPPPLHDNLSPLSDAIPPSDVLPPLASGLPLRILPLGDSITFGWGALDKTGYRGPLHSLLSRTNPVSFIGRIKHGQMPNNNCECYPGFAIGHILAKAPLSLDQRPNVVLLMAGTNDIVLDLNVAKIDTVMGRMLDLVLDKAPDAAVLVSTIPPIRHKGLERWVEIYNEEVLPRVVGERRDGGKKIVLLELGMGLDGINRTDNVHPVSEAYGVIADMWYRGIREVDGLGWIGEPVKVRGEGRFRQVRLLVFGMTKIQVAGVGLAVGALAFAAWRTLRMAMLLFRQ